MKKTLTCCLFLFVLSVYLFAAETVPAGSTALGAEVGRAKKNAAGMRVNYLMVGANMFATDHNVVDNYDNKSYDVKYFATDFNLDFQYLFKQVMMNVTFEFMKYNSDMKILKTTGSYTSEKNYNKKVVSASFGYAHEFNNKYLLVLPILGFSYKDYYSPTSDDSYRYEAYHLILGTKFFINVSKYFYIGFDLDFRLLLSNVITVDHAIYGNCRAILRKGISFNLALHLRFNISTHFVISLVPWFHYSHIPRSEGILVNLDDGTKNNATFYESHNICGGLKVFFGVYF